MKRLPSLEPLLCDECAMGAMFEHGHGGFCPLVHRDLDRGERLYERGDDGDHFWLVQAGAVELVRDGDTVGIRTAGMYVGTEVLTVGNYLSDAVALGRTRLCGIPSAEWGCRDIGLDRDDFVWIAPALRVLLTAEEGGIPCANS